DYNSNQRTELLIIMTPHVIRSPGDMERLKQAEFARMSWCEADVFDLHGDVFPQTGMMSQLVDQEDCNVVYPDADPRGRIEQPQDAPAIVPTPRPLSQTSPQPIGQPYNGPLTLEEEIRQRNSPESLQRQRPDSSTPMQLPASVTEAPVNAIGYLPMTPSPDAASLPPASPNVMPAQALTPTLLPPVNSGGNR
ncbi:MAG: hypothetical protein ACK5PZ_10950, partial [Pirellula sp.]